jgi:hypothetical protein
MISGGVYKFSNVELGKRQNEKKIRDLVQEV